MIRDNYQTGHEPGVVVVLDTLVNRDPSLLVGCMARIQTGSGEEIQVPIAGAKEHGPVNSLFFHGLDGDDIPPGCEITIAIPAAEKFAGAMNPS